MPGRIFRPPDVIKIKRATGSTIIPTRALVTQVAAEHWFTTNPSAQVTQVAVEMWGGTTTATGQTVVTQVALEHWASVASVSLGRVQAMVLA